MAFSRSFSSPQQGFNHFQFPAAASSGAGIPSNVQYQECLGDNPYDYSPGADMLRRGNSSTSSINPNFRDPKSSISEMLLKPAPHTFQRMHSQPPLPPRLAPSKNVASNYRRPYSNLQQDQQARNGAYSSIQPNEDKSGQPRQPVRMQKQHQQEKSSKTWYKFLPSVLKPSGSNPRSSNSQYKKATPHRKSQNAESFDHARTRSEPIDHRVNKKYRPPPLIQGHSFGNQDPHFPPPFERSLTTTSMMQPPTALSFRSPGRTRTHAGGMGVSTLDVNGQCPSPSRFSPMRPAAPASHISSYGRTNQFEGTMYVP